MIYAGLIALFAAFRVVKAFYLPDDLWTNFAPVMAIAFAGSLLLGPFGIWFPLLVMALSDILIYAMGNFGQNFDWKMRVLVYVMLALAGWHGKSLGRSTRSIPFVTVTQILWTLSFYFVTNVACWTFSGQYAYTYQGLVQALVWGLPGYQPTWTFLVRSVTGDLGCLMILLLTFNVWESSTNRFRWQTT